MRYAKTANDSTFKYITYFFLKGKVLDIGEANDYLREDNMTKYLLYYSDVDESALSAVINIRWELTNFDKGKIVLTTSREMKQDELDQISKWVSGQNSDGLGEGFEQQDFASYTSPDYDDDYLIWEYEEPSEWDFDEEEDYLYEMEYWYSGEPLVDNYYITCGFDWETNDYKFKQASCRKNIHRRYRRCF